MLNLGSKKIIFLPCFVMVNVYKALTAVKIYMVTPNSQLRGLCAVCSDLLPHCLAPSTVCCHSPPDHAYAVLPRHCLLSISAIIPTVGKHALGTKQTHTLPLKSPRSRPLSSGRPINRTHDDSCVTTGWTPRWTLRVRCLPSGLVSNTKADTGCASVSRTKTCLQLFNFKRIRNCYKLCRVHIITVLFSKATILQNTVHNVCRTHFMPAEHNSKWMENTIYDSRT